MPRFILIVVTTAALFAAVPPTRAQEPARPVQDAPKQVYCPVTPEEQIDPEVFTDYEGRRIYFCCERCRARFLRDPGRYATRLISTGTPVEKQPPEPAMPPQPASAPHEHETKAPTGTADHGASDHHKEQSAGEATASHGHESHAHGHDHGPRWVNFIGRFHPAMTNFPIGVLIAGALAELLFRTSRRPIFTQAARFCIWFATLSGVLTGVLGWCFAGFHLSDSDPLLLTHRWLGTSTVLWMLGLLRASELAHREPPRAVALYLFLLFGGSLLVLTTGFLGGAMVYGIDHYLGH